MSSSAAIHLDQTTKLAEYKKLNWSYGRIVQVEYFPKEMVNVNVVYANENNLKEILFGLADGQPISVDFEWTPPFYPGLHLPIELMQFATSKGVVIVQMTKKAEISELKEFFDRNEFFGKGMSCDIKKIEEVLGKKYNFIDIETAFLAPNSLSLNFELAVENFVGKPSAAFKDKKVSKSNWSKKPLSVQQVLYAGFDAYAMHKVFFKLCSIYGKPNLADIATAESKRLSIASFNFMQLSQIEPSEVPRFTNGAILLSALKNTYFSIGSHSESAEDLWRNSPNLDFSLLLNKSQMEELPRFLAALQAYVSSGTNSIVKTSKGFGCSVDSCGYSCNSIKGAIFHFIETHFGSQVHDKLIPARDAVFYICAVEKFLTTQNGFRCTKCDISFPNEDLAKDHCWNMHAHRLFAEISGLKQKLMSIIGQIFSNIIGEDSICKQCHVRFENEAHLLVHWLGQHATPALLSKAELKNWPLKGKMIFRAKLFKDVDDHLDLTGGIGLIIKSKEDGFNCPECHTDLEKSDLVNHIIKYHLALIPKAPVGAVAHKED